MKKERIVSVPNPDEFGHHDDAKHPGLYPSHPARIIFSGRSGCGKGVAAKNLLARASPPFDRIVVYHYDTESREWLDCEIVSQVTSFQSYQMTLRLFGTAMRNRYSSWTRFPGRRCQRRIA